MFAWLVLLTAAVVAAQFNGGQSGGAGSGARVTPAPPINVTYYLAP